MLDTINSGLFAPWVAKQITVETVEGELLVDVFEVRENPRAAGPNSKRVPFDILLRGAESPCLLGGIYNLRTEDWRLEGVHITRIIPHANSDGSGAFYQAIFN